MLPLLLLVTLLGWQCRGSACLSGDEEASGYLIKRAEENKKK
jgi:hypothetical protein